MLVKDNKKLQNCMGVAIGLALSVRILIPYGAVQNSVYDVFVFLLGTSYTYTFKPKSEKITRLEDHSTVLNIPKRRKRDIAIIVNIVILLSTIGTLTVLNFFIRSIHFYQIIVGTSCLILGLMFGTRINQCRNLSE